MQLAIPPGGEARAREFYAGLLDMTEIEKPAALRGRGGVWFASGEVQLHLGIDNDFRPAKKAHPALRCAQYDSLLAKLREARIEVREAEEPFVDGSPHAYVDDPFGNRLELIAERMSTAS